MFNNRFNSTHKDPLVEAVRQAQQDGEMRRQAEAIVNEQFGVYSRQAVVREDLAAYDTAIEEVYADLKEGKKLADKDYDKDGKVESPKDEVWGSRFRAAKKADKMDEEQAKVTTKHIKAKDREGYINASLKKSVEAGKNLRSMLDKDRAERKKTMEEGMMDTKDPSVQGSGDVKRSAPKEDPSLPKSYPGAASSAPTAQRLSNAKAALKEKWEGSKEDKYEDKALAKKHGMTMKQWEKSAADKKHDAKEKMDEAKYSAKAARAGEDIGKPGKMFSKIAKKAGERYGSEERGKKVAGAILKRIRAKHMKEENLEELSAFGREFAAARKAGQSQFMSKTTGKMTSTAMKSGGSSSTSSAPRPTYTPGTQGVATGKSFADIDRARNAAADKAAAASIKSATAGTDYAKPTKPSAPAATPKTNTPGTQGVAVGKSFAAIDKATNKASDTAATASIKQSTAGSDYAKPSASTPAPKAVDPGAAENKQRASGQPLKESVQIGDYKYRIV